MKIIDDIKSAWADAKKEIRHFYKVVIPWWAKSKYLTIAIWFEHQLDRFRK
jgi:hypothetical protein